MKKKMRYIPILGGIVAALCVLAAVVLAPHMPSQAALAPEETALLAEWSRLGDALAVQRMVEQGACVEAVGADGTTALMTAAGEGHLEVARVLLMHNAQVNAVNKEGESPLHFAALLLENGAAVDARSRSGETALMVAAWSGFEKMVQQLLAAGADAELLDEDGLNAAAHARTVQDEAARSTILQLLGA